MHTYSKRSVGKIENVRKRVFTSLARKSAEDVDVSCVLHHGHIVVKLSLEPVGVYIIVVLPIYAMVAGMTWVNIGTPSHVFLMMMTSGRRLKF